MLRLLIAFSERNTKRDYDLYDERHLSLLDCFIFDDRIIRNIFIGHEKPKPNLRRNWFRKKSSNESRTKVLDSAKSISTDTIFL